VWESQYRRIDVETPENQVAIVLESVAYLLKLKNHQVFVARMWHCKDNFVPKQEIIPNNSG